MPPRPSSAITRYRPASSVPGTKRPCWIELLDEEDRKEPRLIGPAVGGGAGVDVAVIDAFSSWDCDAPHDGQNREPDSISWPHDEHLMDESLATRYAKLTRHHIS